MNFFIFFIAVAFLGAAVFTVGYGLVDRKTYWYRFYLGQQLFADQLVIAVILGTSLARLWFHIPKWVGYIEYPGLDIVIWWRVILWAYLRRSNRTRVVKVEDLDKKSSVPVTELDTE